jgi:hypothetical protein
MPHFYGARKLRELRSFLECETAVKEVLPLHTVLVLSYNLTPNMPLQPSARVGLCWVRTRWYVFGFECRLPAAVLHSITGDGPAKHEPITTINYR